MSPPLKVVAAPLIASQVDVDERGVLAGIGGNRHRGISASVGCAIWHVSLQVRLQGP